MIVEKLKDFIADLYDQHQQLKARNQTMQGRLERLDEVAMKFATSGGAPDASEGFKTPGSGSGSTSLTGPLLKAHTWLTGKCTLVVQGRWA